jgi:manganese/zinc/iron transport system substrate-binding protein
MLRPRLALLLATFATGLLAVLTGCRGEAPSADSSDASGDGAAARPVIVTTIGMVADLARNVAGPSADVVQLIGPDIDPHLYRPTRSDVQRLMSGDLVFYNGLLLEGRMTDALERAAASGRRVRAVTEPLDPATLLEPESFTGHFDPHVWMDPAAWTQTVDVVRDAMIAFDPAEEAAYRERAAAYAAELQALDAYAARVLATVPESSRVLVTAHDAFNYFGRRYGYEVVGIQGLSTESEAGVQDIERLVDLLVDRRIAAVFVESTVSDRNISALIAGARARDHTVVIGGTLYSDAMGPAGSYEGTYIGMIDHNVTTIARALGGEAPAGGMNGRLTE